MGGGIWKSLDVSFYLAHGSKAWIFKHVPPCPGMTALAFQNLAVQTVETVLVSKEANACILLKRWYRSTAGEGQA